MSSETDSSVTLDEPSSSSEEELLHIVALLPRPKIYKLRTNLFDLYDDVDFKERFRFCKEAVHQMLDMFDINELGAITARNFPISPLSQLLITLRYYATESFQQTIGDYINIHKSTVSRIIPRVTKKIASQARQFISMLSTPEKMVAAATVFYNIRQFPRVVGAIDCSHIKIICQGGDNSELFRNRKGWFSINVQVVCNANLRIRDIVARWPGSVHDSTIFNISRLRAQFEAGEFGDMWLLGDSAYACKAYMLTSLANPITPPEQRHNLSHIQTINTVERTYGVWKRRFACLSIGMNVNPEKVCEIIVATTVLHNLGRNLGDDLDGIDILDEITAEAVVAVGGDNVARTALINSAFSR